MTSGREKLPFAKYSVVTLSARRKAEKLFEIRGRDPGKRSGGGTPENDCLGRLHLRASGATVDKPLRACPPKLATASEGGDPRQQELQIAKGKLQIANPRDD